VRERMSQLVVDAAARPAPRRRDRDVAASVGAFAPGGIRPSRGRRPDGGDADATIASIPRARVERVAACGCDVLVTGPTGTGKGRLARRLHDASPRAHRPFVAVNAGAMPEGLLDSHLFGHVQGAFSDAHRHHLGLVREAEGGTLFLDEVGELPPEAQVRLLRLLEEREVQPVGGLGPVPVDVRIVAATGRDLAAMVAAGTFRADLFYRLEVIHLRVAPLRDRGAAEIDRLTEELAAEVARAHGRAALRLAPEARAVLHRHDWPGNVRELRSVLERLAILLHPDDDPDREIGPADLRSIGRIGGPDTTGGAGIRAPGVRTPGSDAALGDALRTHGPRAPVRRARAARAALDAAGGNVTAAARRLGVHRSTVHRWLAAG